MPRQKKRMRLSFVGGRRPSLLHLTRENKENEKNENTHPSSLQNDVSNESKRLSKQFDLPDSQDVLNKSNKKPISLENVELTSTYKSLDGGQVDVSNHILLNKDVNISSNEINKTHGSKVIKQSSLDSAKEIKKDYSECVTEEELGINIDPEESKREEEEIKFKINYAKEELKQWEGLIDRDYVTEFVDEEDPNLIAKLSFNLEKEMEELQTIHNSWAIQVIKLHQIQTERQRLIEIAHKKLDRQYADINVDNNEIQQTPRHLIRKIIDLK